MSHRPLPNDLLLPPSPTKWTRELKVGDSFHVDVVEYAGRQFVRLVVQTNTGPLINMIEASGARWIAGELLNSADEIDPPPESCEEGRTDLRATTDTPEEAP